MPRPSDESLFVAFQQHRDVESLSELFRRRADELLRIAVFLAPRPTDAEDLVQATFLSAIARAETYRTDHRVMSWLCGILTNHARMLRRAERRRQPTPCHEDAGRDPVSAALHSELRQALSRSIKALGEPYRSVLALHLNDGLNSSEISQRLDRPAATVRKQMARAIQQLRTALPLGLATALVVRMSPAQIAAQAAEAAQFVDATEPAAEAGSGAAAAGSPLAWSMASWSALALLAGTAALLWWTLRGDPVQPTTALDLAAGSATPAAPAMTVPVDAAGQSERSQSATIPTAATPRTDRSAHAGPTLTVHAERSDGTPHAAIELLCVRDNGLALTTRLLVGELRRVTTDAAGNAEVPDLPPGCYQLSIGGSLPKASVRIAADDVEKTIVLPDPHRYSGTVTDPNGRPIGGATVYVSETSGRGDLPRALATSDATGYFEGCCLMSHGQIFARHPAYGQSVARRLQASGSLQLELEPAVATITVTVCDPLGEPLANCLVGMVPKSQFTNYYVPQLGVTDGQGRCTLPGPGARPATIIAQRVGRAHGRADLGKGETRVTVPLRKPTTVRGVLRTEDGSPADNRTVTLSVAASRTNEPIAPMLALRARTDAEGRFAFDSAPRARCQVRIYSDQGNCIGPTMSQFVLAGVDIDLRDAAESQDATSQLELVVPARARIRGRLQTDRGAPLADYHVLAVPARGSAGHRMFRRRVARTDADGRFELPSVADDEDYQLGFYPPERWWPNPITWPTALATANAHEPCLITLDPTSKTSGALQCQALLPTGKPATRATFELRHLAYHAPLTCAADRSGAGRFSQLPAGDYWLVVRSPGLGAETLAVTIGGGEGASQEGPPRDLGTVDLGAVQLRRAARVSVRLVGSGGTRPRTRGVRLVGQRSLGDKFVSTTSQANGIATLPALPPGEAHLLVHGPGVAPRRVTRRLQPGRQWFDLEVEAANTVTLRFPFALADNPFVLNGPLHVRIFDAEGGLVLEDYVGRAAVRGRFDLATGLRPGSYTVRARSLWNALAVGSIQVPSDGSAVLAELPLQN